MNTTYLLLKANTNSEWDSVEFALLALTPELIERLKQRQQALASLKGVFDTATLNSDVVEFYTDIQELPPAISEPFETLPEEEGMIVTLSEDQVQALSQPEQTIKYGEITFSAFDILFKSFGKHTDEAFWVRLSLEAFQKLPDSMVA